jgi:signal transduction histidine kinase
VPDIRLDPDYVVAIATTRSEIVVPLHKGNVVIGVLNVESPVLHGLTDDDARLLSFLGDQVSVAIENAALYDRLRRHSTDLEKTVAERTARLAEALEQTKEADRLKTQFVADVSHELRTPLTNIRLYLELIGRRTRRPEYPKRSTGSQRLGSVEDLLAIHAWMPARIAAAGVVDLNEPARGLLPVASGCSTSAGFECRCGRSLRRWWRTADALAGGGQPDDQRHALHAPWRPHLSY